MLFLFTLKLINNCLSFYHLAGNFFRNKKKTIKLQTTEVVDKNS